MKPLAGFSSFARTETSGVAGRRRWFAAAGRGLGDTRLLLLDRRGSAGRVSDSRGGDSVLTAELAARGG